MFVEDKTCFSCTIKLQMSPITQKSRLINREIQNDIHDITYYNNNSFRLACIFPDTKYVE